MQQWLARLGAGAMLMAADAAVAAGPAATKAEPEAEASPADDPEPGPTVVVVLRPPGADPLLFEALETAQAQLRPQGLELSFVDLGPDESAAGRARALVADQTARGVFWFDTRIDTELRVFLLDVSGAAYVRRVPVDPDGAEASREAAWLIVESGSMALASGQQVAMEQARDDELEPEPKPKPEPEPKPEPKPDPPIEETPELPPAERTTFGRVSLYYLGAGYADAIPWSSGVGLDGALDLGRRWRIGLSYGLLLPWRRGEPAVTWRHRVELRGGPRFGLTPRLELAALLGSGLELLRWRSSAASADGGIRPAGHASLDAGLGVQLTGRLWLSIEPGVEVLLNQFAFVECEVGAEACAGSQRRVVLSPWRVRPRARVGLALRI